MPFLPYLSISRWLMRLVFFLPRPATQLIFNINAILIKFDAWHRCYISTSVNIDNDLANNSVNKVHAETRRKNCDDREFVFLNSFRTRIKCVYRHFWTHAFRSSFNLLGCFFFQINLWHFVMVEMMRGNEFENSPLTREDKLWSNGV